MVVGAVVPPYASRSMLPKTPGAVGCAHCQAFGAERACQSCGRAVCAACADDWSSCPQRKALEVRLGLGARLRSVDPSGRLGLVSTWSWRLLLVDLVAAARIDVDLGRHAAEVASARAWPQLAVDHRLVRLEVDSSGSYQGASIKALGGATHVIDALPSGPTALNWNSQPKALQTCTDQALVLVPRADEVVEVIDVATAKRVSALSVAGQVIHAVGASSRDDLAVLGGWGRAWIFRCSTGQLLGTLETPEGDVEWIGTAAGRVALITQGGTKGRQLQVLQLNDARTAVQRVNLQTDEHAGLSTVMGAAVRLDLAAQWSVAADLSPDGRLLALAVKAGDSRSALQVIDLASGGEQTLEGHTDAIHFARFVDGGRLLVTADMDNRVILWPLDGTRIAEERVPSRRVGRELVPLPPR